MELTFIGVIQLVVGFAIVLAGSLRHAFVFFMISGLFGGAAAILLPALGGSSIPPFQFACLFVYLRILAPGGGFVGALPEAMRANRWLFAYAMYGIASAVIAPRLFANRIDVVPLRFEYSRKPFDIVPLGPTSQNLTTSLYLVATLAIAVAAHIVCRIKGGARTIISVGIAVGWLHIAFGLMVVMARGTPLDGFFSLFRNGGYAQLDQTYGDFVRIRGVFPEPSSFAEFGFAYFVLNSELWYRSIRPRATGSVALGLALILFFSTSSTAYVALAVYLAVLCLRIALLPYLAEGARVRQLGILLFAAAVLISCALLWIPQLVATVSRMIWHMTAEKSDSGSAQQRLFFVLQGWEAFKASYGLGIGLGSFRSSSMIMAMLGSTGVIGLACFGAYAFSVFQPARQSTYGRTGNLDHTLGGAFGSAAIFALIPACVGSPSADLGANFAFLAGAALALRPGSEWEEAAQSVPPRGEPDEARRPATESA